MPYLRRYRRGGLRYRRPVRRAVATYRRAVLRYRRPVRRAVPRYSRLNKPETKYVDSTPSGGAVTVFPSSWLRYDLTANVIQGTTSSTRLGNVIRARSIGVNFGLYRNASGSTVQRVRYILVRYVDSEGGIPLAGDIFQTTGVFLPQRNLDWTQSFRILADRTITLDSAIKNQATVRIKRRLAFKCKYDANGGTTSDQVSNSLFLMLWSDQSPPNQPTVQDINVRFTFND